MKRALVVLVVLTMLAVPVALAGTPTAEAAGKITIFTKERGSNKAALYACYSVVDLNDGQPNGGVTSACDIDDGADGKTVVTLGVACDPCRVTQSLRDKPDNTPTDYLLQPHQDGPVGTYTFKNFLKPYLVVTARDAKTDKLVKGACIFVEDIERGGAVFSACDGGPKGATFGDQDGRKNGKIKTTRLPNTGAYRVVNKSPFPAGYRAAKPVKVSADPAKTGEFEKATIELRRSR